MGINIVLVEPEIPQNTGNIARTCAALNIDLHIIGSIPFVISERTVKRAGLDYWPYVRLHRHENLDDFFSIYPLEYCILTSSRGQHLYTEFSYPRSHQDCALLFGKESTGLPTSFIEQHRERSIHIPMRPEIRSLNLANTVAILAYYIASQHNFSSILNQRSS